jgi:hypothetical protein
MMLPVTNSAWAPILLKQEGIGTREAAARRQTTSRSRRRD